MQISSILEGKPFMTAFGIVGYSSVVLIQNEGLNILYDCGNRGSALQLKAALLELKLKPEDITHVVISHLHFDHVGNLPLFSNAKILLSECEMETASKEPDDWHCLQTVSYLRSSDKVAFIREGEEITDGVLVMELPGHTKGLIGLKAGDDTVLCSDAIKNRYELWEDAPVMTIDEKSSKASRERIIREARFIYPGHDEMLDLLHPVNKEKIEVLVRTANGTDKLITIP